MEPCDFPNYFLCTEYYDLAVNQKVNFMPARFRSKYFVPSTNWHTAMSLMSLSADVPEAKLES